MSGESAQQSKRCGRQCDGVSAAKQQGIGLVELEFVETHMQGAGSS
jgi:hypothetical protein